MVNAWRMPCHTPHFNASICLLTHMNYDKSHLRVLTNIVPLKTTEDHYWTPVQAITNEEINLLRGTTEFYDMIFLRNGLFIEDRDVFNHAGRKTNP